MRLAGGGAARTSSRDNGKASLNVAAAGSGVLENWNIEAPRCAGMREEVGVAPACVAGNGEASASLSKHSRPGGRPGAISADRAVMCPMGGRRAGKRPGLVRGRAWGEPWTCDALLISQMKFMPERRRNAPDGALAASKLPASSAHMPSMPPPLYL